MTTRFDLFPVIMAGGTGTRFWPLSRRARPKQVLALDGDETLIRQTLQRVSPSLAPPTRALVVTTRALKESIAHELPELPSENIMAEPFGRNTAPCIGWAATRVRQRQEDGILLILPADHRVRHVSTFQQQVEEATALASAGSIVTFGIEPLSPHTGFGYIEQGEPLSGHSLGGPSSKYCGYRVARFVEKPDVSTAQRYLASQRFLWNSGIFVASAKAILGQMEQHLPTLHHELLQIAAQQAGSPSEAACVQQAYNKIDPVSFDHGIMEHARHRVVLPARFDWSDLGGWQAAWEHAPKDAHGNFAEGLTVMEGVSNCYVRATGKRVIALAGVEDLVVVDTDDALLIVPREQSEKVKDLVMQLKGRYAPLL